MQMVDYAKPRKPFRSQATPRSQMLGTKIARACGIAGATLWVGCVLILMVHEFLAQF